MTFEEYWKAHGQECVEERRKLFAARDQLDVQIGRYAARIAEQNTLLAELKEQEVKP